MVVRTQFPGHLQRKNKLKIIPFKPKVSEPATEEVFDGSVDLSDLSHEELVLVLAALLEHLEIRLILDEEGLYLEEDL